MPRAPRIEYPNAFYHVMNRGTGRKSIFHDQEYFIAFLNILSESHQKFGIMIHAYCLMSNHYHLIIETPSSNLSRAMRHINGVYTQRYNRLKKTDGSLFRGRFKAILIDEDSYLLNLNRYIHRNPIKFVKHLENYKWSSYPAYLNLVKSPKWLCKDKIIEAFNGEDFLKSYQAYILGDQEDEYFVKHYSKKNIPMILGSEDFKKRIHAQITDSNNVNKGKILKDIRKDIGVDEIMELTSKAFNIEKDSIKNRQIGRAKANFPRKFSMYLCQIYLHKSLFEISKEFNLTSSGAVAKAIYLVKKEIDKSGYKRELDFVINGLWK